jgi:hypothetical protein
MDGFVVEELLRGSSCDRANKLPLFSELVSRYNEVIEICNGNKKDGFPRAVVKNEAGRRHAEFLRLGGHKSIVALMTTHASSLDLQHHGICVLINTKCSKNNLTSAIEEVWSAPKPFFRQGIGRCVLLESNYPPLWDKRLAQLSLLFL